MMPTLTDITCLEVEVDITFLRDRNKNKQDAETNYILTSMLNYKYQPQVMERLEIVIPSYRDAFTCQCG
jgi:hypothetical protein